MRGAIALPGLLLCLLVSHPSASVYASSCSVQSGESTAALVELYTSQGCTGCPAAERWLYGLRSGGYASQRVVPVSLHVDYGDYLGWRAREPLARLRKLTPLQRRALVFSPQVLLQGRDFRGWRTPAFDESLERINTAPAKARLQLQIESMGPRALTVQARAELLQASGHDDAALYLAAYENKVQDGRGYVVLEWLGPFALGSARRRAERREMPLLPEGSPGNSGMVGFVQDRRSLEVLQALMLPVCPGGKG